MKVALRLIYHLDDLRRQKHISVDNLCEGICSDRQYRKYLSGDNNISDKRIIEFCSKLNISPRDFYSTLTLNDNVAREKAFTVNDCIVRKEFSKADDLLSELNGNYSNQLERFIMYCRISLDHHKGNAPIEHSIDLLRGMLDFDDIKKVTAFDSADILIISLISELEVKQGRYEWMYDFATILTSSNIKFVSASDIHVISPQYSNLAIYLGRAKDYERCLKVCDSGIKFVIDNHHTRSLTRLYLCKALVLKDKNLTDESKKYAIMSVLNAITLQNEHEQEVFNNIIKREFNIDVLELVGKLHLVEAVGE